MMELRTCGRTIIVYKLMLNDIALRMLSDMVTRTMYEICSKFVTEKNISL